MATVDRHDWGLSSMACSIETGPDAGLAGTWLDVGRTFHPVGNGQGMNREAPLGVAGRGSGVSLKR